MPDVAVALRLQERQAQLLEARRLQALESEEDPIVVVVGHLERSGSGCRKATLEVGRDGIYELRAKHLRVNYRILYLFFDRQAIVVTHGIVKQRAAVPASEIDLAIERKRRFEENPKRHTYLETF